MALYTYVHIETELKRIIHYFHCPVKYLREPIWNFPDGNKWEKNENFIKIIS